MKYFLCIYTLFFALLATAAPGKIPQGWQEQVHCRRQEGNLIFNALWDGDQPLELIVKSLSDGEAVRLEMDAESFRLFSLPAIGFIEEPLPVRMVSEMPGTQMIGSLPVLLKFREDTWSLYIDGSLRAVAVAPLALPAVILFQGDWLFAPRQARFQPVPRVDYTTDFMIEEGAGDQLYPWVRQSGSWRIHTALDEALTRPETNLQQTKRAPLTADKSPNFYSLKGGGKDAVITTGYDYFDNYCYTGSLQLNEGEAGLVFYYRARQRGNNAEDSSENAAENAVEEELQEEYFALTLLIQGDDPEKREVRLWHYKDGQRTYLARAQVPLYRKQWYLPGIEVYDDLIIASLDHYELFRVRRSMPPGGKIGFYANAEEELRFDDVLLKHIDRIDLDNVGQMRFRELWHSGGFYRQDNFFVPGTSDEQCCLQARAGTKNNEYLVFGRPWNNNLVFSCRVSPQSLAWELGLLAGFTEPDQPHYIFGLQNEGEQVLAELQERQADGKYTQISQLSIPIPDEDFELCMDASDSECVRFIVDGKLLAVARRSGELAGGAGLWLGKASQADFTQLKLSRHREQFLEQEQKNPIFQTDSFMRHWASPEGQWIAGPHSAYWHKGDFFADFFIRLPAKPDTELHLAVPEEADQGSLRLKLSSEAINVSFQEPGSETLIEYAFAFSEEERGKTAEKTFDFYCEGYLFWLVWNGEVVLEGRLPKPLKNYGTKIFCKGYGIPDLARSKVTRSMVIDEYFNESPHSWLAAGGDWQIINRFQCTPSWSHMIGEAPMGLGSFWRKQVFEGDMTLEFYAGTRQDFYEHAGNLNCTMMASETSPSSGYTFTCTEWDHNRSQNWSRFYRNGEVLINSEEYLVPRLRKGQVRRVLNPLISAGRPVHGAWFYIKIRKIGNVVEFYFDDEKIYSFTDDEALQKGLVGIWTFVHSMTLAQIKISCEKVEARSIPVRMLAPDAIVECSVAPTPIEAPLSASLGGFPVDPLHADYWYSEDPVGHAKLTRFAHNSEGFLLRNHLGGGNMFVKSRLVPLVLADIAGWYFEAKRSAMAQFNLSYVIGPLAEDKEISVKERYFHHLSGSSFSEEDWRMSGSSELAPVAEVTDSREDWQPVYAWIPSDLRRGDNLKEDCALALHGFGIEQLDFMASGITGNGPGQAYAVKNLQPIYYGLPELKMPEDMRVYVRHPWNQRFGHGYSEPADLREQLLATQRPGLNEVFLLFRQGERSLIQKLLWLCLPEELPFALAWDEAVPEAIRLSSLCDYVDPRFAKAGIKIGELQLTAEKTGLGESLLFRLPLAEPVLKEAYNKGELELNVDPGSGAQTRILALAERSLNAPPILVQLQGFSTFFKNYEVVGELRDEHDKQFLSYDNSLQRQYLLVRNNAGRGRLLSSHSLGFSVAKYPVFQFRYRAEDMSHVSLHFVSGTHYALVSEQDNPSGIQQVRYAEKFVRDNTWQTWTGLISDAFVRQPFTPNRFLPGTMQIRSNAGYDQTGRFSKIGLDDLVFGPAVKSAEQLYCTPHYADPDGVAKVSFALLSGAKAYWQRSAEEQAGINWQDSEPGKEMRPGLDGLSDGIHHLLFKAVDRLGAESAVTDLPFLLDRKPLQISHRFADSDDLQLNGVELQVVLDNGSLSPWAIEDALFLVAGKERKLTTWSNRFVHSAAQDSLYLNYPMILRPELNQANDGDEIEFAIDNIVDGAGNSTARYSIPVKVDYGSDKQGPSWEQLVMPKSVLAFFNWDGRRSDNVVFRALPNHRSGDIAIHNKAGQSPCLVSYVYDKRSQISCNLKWQPAQFPYLAFRLQLSAVSEKILLHVLLTTTEDKVYTISLTSPRKNEMELNRKQKFDWVPGVWQNFNFDVRQMFLEAGLNDEALQKLSIKSIDIRRMRAEGREELMLDDFFIYGMPEKAETSDELKWYAFDRSGLAGLEASAYDSEAKEIWQQGFTVSEAVDLHALRAKSKGLVWLCCTAKDKAGNLAVPFWLPLAGTAQ